MCIRDRCTLLPSCFCHSTYHLSYRYYIIYLLLVLCFSIQFLIICMNYSSFLHHLSSLAVGRMGHLIWAIWYTSKLVWPTLCLPHWLLPQDVISGTRFTGCMDLRLEKWKHDFIVHLGIENLDSSRQVPYPMVLSNPMCMNLFVTV